MGGGGTYLYAETCFEVAIMSVSTSVRKTKSELLFLLKSLELSKGQALGVCGSVIEHVYQGLLVV